MDGKSSLARHTCRSVNNFTRYQENLSTLVARSVNGHSKKYFTTNSHERLSSIRLRVSYEMYQTQLNYIRSLWEDLSAIPRSRHETSGRHWTLFFDLFSMLSWNCWCVLPSLLERLRLVLRTATEPMPSLISNWMARILLHPQMLENSSVIFSRGARGNKANSLRKLPFKWTGFYVSFRFHAAWVVFEYTCTIKILWKCYALINIVIIICVKVQ